VIVGPRRQIRIVIGELRIAVVAHRARRIRSGRLCALRVRNGGRRGEAIYFMLAGRLPGIRDTGSIGPRRAQAGKLVFCRLGIVGRPWRRQDGNLAREVRRRGCRLAGDGRASRLRARLLDCVVQRGDPWPRQGWRGPRRHIRIIGGERCIAVAHRARRIRRGRLCASRDRNGVRRGESRHFKLPRRLPGIRDTGSHGPRRA
jgi:hypothetical protein